MSERLGKGRSVGDYICRCPCASDLDMRSGDIRITDKQIASISSHSKTPENEEVIRFLGHYKLTGLCDATFGQAARWIEDEYRGDSDEESGCN